MEKKTNLLARAVMALLLALPGYIGAWADNSKIIVWLNDGNKSEVLFADMPELTYADGYVSIQSNNPSTTLSWPIENMKRLTFESSSTDVRDVKATGLDLLSEQFDAYDLSGKMVKKQISSLSELPPGVYIVNDGSVTIKVLRK